MLHPQMIVVLINVLNILQKIQQIHIFVHMFHVLLYHQAMRIHVLEFLTASIKKEKHHVLKIADQIIPHLMKEYAQVMIVIFIVTVLVNALKLVIAIIKMDQIIVFLNVENSTTIALECVHLIHVDQ
jgi:hypothetical protein